MLFSELETEVRRIVNDPNSTVYALLTLERYANQGLRKIGVATGKTVGRATQSLVQGQSVYEIGVGTRKINNIRIIPEDQTLAKVTLIERDFTEIPNVTETERDPIYYALNVDGGTDANRIEYYLWPASARSAAGAIVIDYDIDYVVTPSTPSFVIPIQRAMEQALIYEISALLLLESDDGSDLEKAKIFRQASEDEIRRYQPTGSMTAYIDLNRRMP